MTNIDWSAALDAADPLARYRAVSEILAAHGHGDAASVPHPDALACASGATPDRAILSGAWADPTTDDALTSWALRQAADAAAVVPMRAVVAEAARTVAAADRDAADVIRAVRSGDVQAASSGRVMSSRLAAALGMAGERRAVGRAASALLARTLDAVAAAALPLLDAHDAAGREVLGLTMTRQATTADRRAVRAYRAERIAAGDYRAPGRRVWGPYGTSAADPARDSLGYDARMGYAPITCATDPTRVREPRLTVTPPQAVGSVAPDRLALLTPTGARVVVTARPDLTRAAWAADLPMTAAQARRAARRAASQSQATLGAAQAPQAAPTALDRLRAGAARRATA